ncbi:MAG: glycosyltransferase family 4 protein [Acidimicrobiia bacterium]
MTRVALHVGQLLQPVPGGIGTYVRALVRALPAAGVDLTTFATGTPGNLTGPHVELGPPRGSLRYECWHRLRWPSVRIPSDVVHAPSLAVPPTRTPLVVTIHDVAFLRYPAMFTARGVRFHERGLELARRHAAAIITPSHFTRDELIREGFDGTRVRVAQHGAPPADALFTDPQADAATLTSVGIGGPFVLAVGTIEPRKRFDVAAAAAGAIDGITLVIAGPRGWNDVPGLDAPHVRLLGTVDAPTLASLYRTAAAAVVPSEYEGFGLPALEAMAHGCPVITSDAQSLVEVAGDAGVVAPVGDVDAWRAAIASVLDDPEHRAQLARAAIRRAGAFTWSESARIHAETYSAVAH